MLILEESAGRIHGIQIGRGVPPISHLLFVDDLFIFSRASREEAQVIWACLQKYGSWSGQRLNVRKLSISFSRHVRREISHDI